MVNLRKSFTSTHKTFENAMAKLDMLFNCIVLLFVIVAFLIAYDIGVQQFAVGVSSVCNSSFIFLWVFALPLFIMMGYSPFHSL